MERENEMTASEVAEVAEAAALMAVEAEETGPAEDARPATEADPNSVSDVEAESASVAPDDATAEPATEFWSAEDKAAWTAVPP